jgi:hypothetical protein
MDLDPAVLGLKEHIFKPKKLLPLMEKRLPDVGPSAFSEAAP